MQDRAPDVAKAVAEARFGRKSAPFRRIRNASSHQLADTELPSLAGGCQERIAPLPSSISSGSDAWCSVAYLRALMTKLSGAARRMDSGFRRNDGIHNAL